MLKTKTKRTLNKAREKCLITYKETPLRLTADLSSETMEAQRQFIVLKKKKIKQESYIPQNYLSEIKTKYRHSQINKNLESIASRLTL